MNNIIIKIKKPYNWSKLPLYKKIYYYKLQLDMIYSQYVDKLNAKDIVSNVCGDRCKIPRVIRILTNYSDLQQSDLNNNYFIKAAHGSGWLIDPKQEKNLTKNILQLKSWNKIYSYYEKQYSYLQPKFFIEEKITCLYNGLTGSALDIKVFCFYGIPQFILIQNNTKRNFYDMNWSPIKPLEFEFQKPVLFDQIIDISKELSRPFEFVRIDLYIGIDGVYFSEFTFTPRNGIKEFTTEKELELGKYWF